MRKKGKNLNGVKLPIIEIGEKTRSWLFSKSITSPRMANLNWREFVIVNRVKNHALTVLVTVKDDESVAIKGYAPKDSKKNCYDILKEKPTYTSCIRFGRDGYGFFASTEHQKGVTPIIEDDIAKRIIPIIIFMMSTEKHGVILKRDESCKKQEKYAFVQTELKVFGEVIKLHESLSCEPESKLLSHGLAVSINKDNIPWLEKFADDIRSEQDKKDYPIYNTDADKIALKKISAISVYDGKSFMRLQIRNCNDILEIAYYESEDKNCQMLMYANFKSNPSEIMVAEREEDPDYVDNVRKIVSLIENVLVFLRTWDWEFANKPDGSYYPCEVRPICV